MADQRPPGDTSVKTRTRLVNWKYTTTQPFVNPIIGSTNMTVFRSERPSYAKGVVITLPGGDTFRKATNYSHKSWEVGAYSPATVGPGKNTVGYTLFGTDGGRDGTLVIGGLNSAGSNFSVPTDARNEAVTKALNKIADQKINLGENLATLHQTIGLFTGKTSILVNLLYKGLRSKSIRQFLNYSASEMKKKGLVGSAASEYLAFVYGLRPLMQDVYEAGELVKHHAGKTLLLKAVGSAHRTRQLGLASKGAATSAVIDQITNTINEKVKCTLWARIDPNHQGLRSLNELGLLNPWGLAWDLVPFSFCVDWVLPIGPVLYALTAPAGLLFVDGTISYRRTDNQVVRYQLSAGGWNSTIKPNYPTFIPVTFEGYDRSTLGTWPLPGLWFDGDPFRGDRSLKALALAILQLRGARSPIR